MPTSNYSVPIHRKLAFKSAVHLFSTLFKLNIIPYFLNEFASLPRQGQTYGLTDIRKYTERFIPHDIEEWIAQSNIDRDEYERTAAKHII